ncbi:ATP-binding protein [Haloarchaeobius sp. DT45]|uniref:receiver/sensor box histidine kinase n=1 Tax=Haloarchaeobius sp. DT45 TaxID=3446116 RepID=UPI003F6AD6CF
MTHSSGARPARFRDASADDSRTVLLVAATDDDPPDGLSEFTVRRAETPSRVEDVLAGDDGRIDCVVHQSSLGAVSDTLSAVRSVGDVPYVLFGADPAPDVLETVLSAPETEYVPRLDTEESDLLATRVRRAVGRVRRERDRQLKERALDQAGVGITIAGPDESLVYVNQGFEELTGYDAEAVLGENCRFLQGPDTDPERVASIRAALDEEEPISIVLRNYDAGGDLFWNQLDIAPVFDEEGRLTHYFGFQKDVTEREELAEELRRQNERLDEFAGVVSHDIRGPLSVAKGHVETLADEEPSPGLDATLAALDRIERMVGDVLTLAREGEAVADPEAVGLESVVTKAWQTGKTGELRIDLAGDLGMVEADPERLQTLFENLFRNAHDHATGATTVTVGRTDAEGDSGFYVEDDGAGIPEADRDSVFDQGYTTDADGTGFGLAIVQTVAEAHGWSVSVDSSETGGARFVVSGVQEA